jgi:uncharacterized membrane protein SpoIIM required for sporulation
MIIDLEKFLAVERPFWEELERMMGRQEADPHRRMSFEEIQRLHYLYQRASSDLARLATFSAEFSLRRYLESLVGRAYGLIYARRARATRLAPWAFLRRTFPGTFRRHFRLFAISLAIMLAGAVFGGAALVLDPEAKAVLMPFDHLRMDPSERVAQEEDPSAPDRLKGAQGRFSAFLMTHNTRVSILVLALGMSWGIGTVLLLFTNGVMLGAVCADYVRAGQSTFLIGWLLPHGATEIPAILIAGQAGLLLAGALIGRSAVRPLGDRLRSVTPDVVTLIGGVALLLVWAGLVEGFFSQYHEPVIPYVAKIAFGALELGLLIFYLGFVGRKR